MYLLNCFKGSNIFIFLMMYKLLKDYNIYIKIVILKDNNLICYVIIYFFILFKFIFLIVLVMLLRIFFLIICLFDIVVIVDYFGVVNYV